MGVGLGAGSGSQKIWASRSSLAGTEAGVGGLSRSF